MIIDFFHSPCKEPAKADKFFGLCDNQDQTKAYSDTINKSKWIARVNNNNSYEVSFTAIDHCINILKKDSNDIESSCDGMLVFNNSIYLVELKEKMKSGVKEGKNQIENTIKFLKISPNFSYYKKRKAFICNKKFPNFHKINASERKSFFEKNEKFRLDVNTEITLK